MKTDKTDSVVPQDSAASPVEKQRNQIHDERIDFEAVKKALDEVDEMMGY